MPDEPTIVTADRGHDLAAARDTRRAARAGLAAALGEVESR